LVIASIAVLAGLAIVVMTFGFTAHADPVAQTGRHLVAGDAAAAAAAHEIARLEKSGYTQSACTRHGTLMLNRATGQTRVIAL
jgi:hypothetical protein